MGIFLLTSIKEHSTSGSFHTIPSQGKLVLTAALLIPRGVREGGSRQGQHAAAPAAAQETQEFLEPPLCYGHRGSEHTCVQQTHLRHSQSPTDWSFQNGFVLFCLKLPNPNHSACNFTIQCNNGEGQVGVHGERTEPAGASLCWGLAKTSPLGMPGHGESRTFAQKWQTQMGFGQTESGAGFTFHIIFCIKKYISEICYRQGQDYWIHNVNRLLSDFIFVKLLL